MALDEKSHDRIMALFAARLPDRMRALEKEKSQMLRTAAVRGSAHSSYVTRNLYKLCVEELEILVALAWQDMKRVMVALEVQPSAGLAGDLRNEVRALVSTPYAEIQKRNEHWIAVQRDRARSLEPAMEEAYRKIDPEIDLFVDTMSAKRVHASGSSSIVIQGNAHIGAIVASPGASAQVTQQNIADSRQLILEAMDRVLNAVLASSYGSVGPGVCPYFKL